MKAFAKEQATDLINADALEDGQSPITEDELTKVYEKRARSYIWLHAPTGWFVLAK